MIRVRVTDCELNLWNFVEWIVLQYYQNVENTEHQSWRWVWSETQCRQTYSNRQEVSISSFKFFQPILDESVYKSSSEHETVEWTLRKIFGSLTDRNTILILSGNFKGQKKILHNVVVFIRKKFPRYKKEKRTNNDNSRIFFWQSCFFPPFLRSRPKRMRLLVLSWSALEMWKGTHPKCIFLLGKKCHLAKMSYFKYHLSPLPTKLDKKSWRRRLVETWNVCRRNNFNFQLSQLFKMDWCHNLMLHKVSTLFFVEYCF